MHDLRSSGIPENPTHVPGYVCEERHTYARYTTHCAILAICLLAQASAGSSVIPRLSISAGGKRLTTLYQDSCTHVTLCKVETNPSLKFNPCAVVSDFFLLCNQRNVETVAGRK